MWVVQTLSVVAIFSAATGIFFAFIFLSIRGNKAFANRFLSALLIVFAIRIAELAFYWTGYIGRLPHVWNVSSSLPLLFGVLIYFYIKYSQSEEEKLNSRFYLHLIPFFVYLVYLMPGYLADTEYKLEQLRNITSQNPVYGVEFYTFRTLKLIHMIVYAVLSIDLVKNFRNQNLNSLQQKEAKWHIYLVGGFIIFLTITGIQTFGIAVSGYDYIIELDSALMLTCAFMIYSSIYFTVKNPDIFIGSLRKLPLLKYKRSSLTDEKAERYAEQLKQLMKEEEPYLEPELKLSDLAEKLSLQSHHVSQVINDKLGKSFNDFVNEYRIEKAKELLKDPNYDRFTILAISYEVGFKNKASFNSAFKKFVEVTPSEYKKNGFVLN